MTTLLGIAAVGRLASRLLEASDPWATVYAHNRVVSTAVLFFHVAPLVFGAGAAFVMDRMTLRVSREGPAERARHLYELERVHRVVVTGLACSFVSGLLLFFADARTFLGAPLFWIKISLVASLLANGLLLKRTEQALLAQANSDSLWHRMRTLSALSGALWLATTLSGVVLLQFS